MRFGRFLVALFRGDTPVLPCDPKAELGDPQPLHQQLPGVKPAAAGAGRAPSYCMGEEYYCKKRGGGGHTQSSSQKVGS